MSTAGDIVTGALRFIQYQSAYEPVTAEDMDVGIDTLNDMMASWSTDGVRVGYNAVQSSSDYVTAPPQSILAIKQNLGVMMAPMFGTNALNPLLISRADDSLRRLKGLTITIGDSEYGENAPMGSGNDLYGDYIRAYYGDIEENGYSRFEFSGNSSAETLVADTPTDFSAFTWTVKQSHNFTTTTSGTSVYTEDGIVEANVRAQVLLRGTSVASQVTLYVARNNEHIPSSATRVALDDATDEKLAQIDFGPVGITKNDTIKLVVESTATAVTAVSGYLEVQLCA